MSNEELDLEFLFSRIDFYSGMVRERVCDEIAKLLTTANHYEKILKRLFKWTEDQNLESLNIYSLIILIRAKDLNHSLELPDYEEFKDLFKAKSLMTWLLLEELYKNNRNPNQFNFSFSEPVPKDFEPNGFFKKYIKSFLPSMFYYDAKFIQEENRIPFIKTWCWEWTNIIERDKIKISKYAGSYWGREDDFHYVAFDPKMSEYYRSSYLRTINKFLNTKSISFDVALFHSLRVVPIDFELWKIKPDKVPDWFPEVKKDNKQNIDLSISIILEQIEHLWESQQKNNHDFIVSEFSGLLGENEVYNEVELFGFFQKTKGTKIPEINKVADIFRWENSLGKGGVNYLRFGGDLEPCDFSSKIMEIDDWDVVPVSYTAKPINTPKWLWWRMYRDIWFPAFYLFDDITLIEILPQKISYLNNESEIAFWFDWVNNLREQALANLPPSTGQALLIRKDLIKKVEEKHGFRFCWLCKLTNYTRKYSHTKFDDFSSYKLFGQSNIIRLT